MPHLLRKLSKEHEEEKKSDGDTLATDDHMETDTNTFSKDQNQTPTEGHLALCEKLQGECLTTTRSLGPRSRLRMMPL